MHLMCLGLSIRRPPENSFFDHLNASFATIVSDLPDERAEKEAVRIVWLSGPQAPAARSISSSVPILDTTALFGAIPTNVHSPGIQNSHLLRGLPAFLGDSWSVPPHGGRRGEPAGV
jgi:hypothetical protein